MVDIESWMNAYQVKVNRLFRDRVQFVGLQGSYARVEATAESDIDVVLIVDKLTFADLLLYKDAVRELPFRERLCGFVGGKEELSSWCVADLFHFYFDTVPVQGNLNAIIPEMTGEQGRQAVLAGACHIYHACCHLFLHGHDPIELKMLFKSAYFVMRAEYFCLKHVFAKNRLELAAMVTSEDQPVLAAILDPQVIDADSFAFYAQALFDWSGALIRKYGEASLLNGKNP